ncbi:MAG: MBL fold metallo-hydrolase [Thermodesulfobacteriota bacterium]|nr:MBL fold metallo-hydrolase [Thermodesulfobacteriota bacterium]
MILQPSDMKLMKPLLIILALFVTSFISSCILNPPSFDEVKWRKAVESQSAEKLYSPHFSDGKYFNPWMPMETGRFWLFLRWILSKRTHYTEEERNFSPNVLPGLYSRIETKEDDFIAWIGHSTFLIHLQGEYWLTDPMFSKRAFLPKRVTPPAINMNELKTLTKRVNVLISHNHYDHLDEKSIRFLPEKSRIFVPKGLKKYVASIHSGEVEELDWWDKIDLSCGTKLVCLPSQHWSRRFKQAKNSTLWASYMLISPQTSIYYGGDSGYFIGYREIGRRFSNIQYALIPLTAYHPRWFMYYNHMNAKETLDAFTDINAKYFIPTQWGTFKLGENPPGFPVLDLIKVSKEKDIDSSRILIMDIGQIITIQKDPKNAFK